MIIALTENDKLEQFEKTLLIAICIALTIESVIIILGIVSISRDHYCGSFSFSIYQLVCVIFAAINLILFVNNRSIAAFSIKIAKLCLCIIYVHQLKQNKINDVPIEFPLANA